MPFERKWRGGNQKMKEQQKTYHTPIHTTQPTRKLRSPV